MPAAFLTYDIHPTPSGEKVPGGCAWYRCTLPAHVTGSAWGIPAWDARRGFGVRLSDSQARFGFDTVVLKLLMHASICTVIEQAKAAGQRVIIDVDDLYEAIPEGNVARWETSAERARNRNREHLAASLRLADTLTVSTPFLRDYYSWHPDVRLVRNAIMPEVFERKRPRRDRPVVGFVGAVPWKHGDLDQLSEWLPGFLVEHDLLFHHSGHVPDYQSFVDAVGLPPERVSTYPTVQMHQYPFLFEPIDIGLAPLALNDFNRAKSNVKGLEYAAAGVPFVASPTPEYEHLAESGVGRVAGSVNEWIMQATELLDYRNRKRESAINAATVGRDWCIGNRAQDWREVLAG